jgi:hypothetical protein
MLYPLQVRIARGPFGDSPRDLAFELLDKCSKTRGWELRVTVGAPHRPANIEFNSEKRREKKKKDNKGDRVLKNLRGTPSVF